MKTITIGGVPEHFNLAWYLTLKNGEYKVKGYQFKMEGLLWRYRSHVQST